MKSPDDQLPEQGFELGTLRIDPRAGEVSGPGGREKLEPRVMDVLVMLAEHAGRVVQREDLLTKLWPDAAATDEALSRCIYELRRQLSLAGDDEQLKALVETVPKRGYRLNGKVAWPAAATQPATPRRRWLKPLLLAIAVAVVAVLLWLTAGREAGGPATELRAPPGNVAAHSIAVLPFLDLSEGQDQGHFADGITEEILLRLDRFANLRVIARTSAFAFRGQQQDIREIASQLDVTHVLEGSVRRSGDNIRITAQLIAASDNAHVWSRTFDRSPGDLFAVQDEIAAAVATALRVTLEDPQQTGEAPVKPEAYEPFLQGRFFFNRRAPGDIERAVKYYQDALAIDPGFARAWAALAGAYNLQRARDRRAPERWLKLQGEAARKAVELAPGLAVAHARLAQYYFSAADRQNGDAHFQTAMTLDPDDPLVMGFAGDRAIRRGDLNGVVQIWRQLVDRNPLSPIDRGNLAHFLAAAGHLDEAETEYRRTLELNPDAHWFDRFDLARVLVRQKRYEQAVAEVMRLPIGEPRDSGMAILHEVPGYEAAADAALQRVAALPLDLESIRLAEIYATRGMKGQAFASLQAVRDALERSADSRHWAIAQTHELQMDMIQSSYLEPLRTDSRWAELMADPLRR